MNADDNGHPTARSADLEDRYGPRAIVALRQIAGYCADAAQIASSGREAFLADMILQRAAEATIARIGETVRNRLPPALCEEFPGQPWSLIVALRVRVAHVYDSLDYTMVWDTLTNSLPALRSYIETTMLPYGR